MKFVGIDGCKAGWFYFFLTKSDCFGYGIVHKVEELQKLFSKSDKICIDIPIGLKDEDTKERSCDLEARKLLGKRSSSIFPAPSRKSLSANDYWEASKINFQSTGRKLSKQSWGILPKIKEVDKFINNSTHTLTLKEMHPELAFLALNNFRSLHYNKKKAEGIIERKQILKQYLEDVEEIYPKIINKFLRKDLAKDDILDAIACAVSIKYSKKLQSIPSKPEYDSCRLRMEIVYPSF